MPLTLSYSLADQEFARTKSLGIWNVSTQLLHSLANRPELQRLTVFSNRTQHDFSWPASAIVQPHNTATSGRLGRMFWDQWSIYSAARASGNSWLFLPKGFTSFLRAPPVHLAAYVHDTMHDFYRRTYQPNPYAGETSYFLRSLRATLRHARVIFTNTDFTRQEVRRLAQDWGLPAPNVVTAGIGFAPVAEHATPLPNRHRILVLTGSAPHKCTRMAIQFLQQWSRAQHQPADLAWIGPLPPGVSLPAVPGWKHHSRLSPTDYQNNMDQAAVVVYFSEYEGFGMPPVEATLAGAAAVYSKVAALQEVMGECGFAFDNGSFESFACALNAARKTQPMELAQWKTQLSQRHTWPIVVDRILHSLHNLHKMIPS